MSKAGKELKNLLKKSEVFDRTGNQIAHLYITRNWYTIYKKHLRKGVSYYFYGFFGIKTVSLPEYQSQQDFLIVPILSFYQDNHF